MTPPFGLASQGLSRKDPHAASGVSSEWILGTGRLLGQGDLSCLRKGLGGGTKHKTSW